MIDGMVSGYRRFVRAWDEFWGIVAALLGLAVISAVCIVAPLGIILAAWKYLLS